jgi:lipopolysaccharide/colanic/teichoic acid biosynthesis glycosyltransferase
MATVIKSALQEAIGLKTRHDLYTQLRKRRERFSTSYQQMIYDLQYAIDAGDVEFAPAAMLLLREAIHLALNYQNFTPQNYNLMLSALKSAYHDLLKLEVTHPVGKALQQRYRDNYDDHFWDFLELKRVLAHARPMAATIASHGNVHKHRYFRWKRIIDLVLASILLILSLPLMLLVAVLIKLDSPGPIFFVQERVGSRRKTHNKLTTWEPRNFRFYKFRSMYCNTDQSLHQRHIERWISGQLEKDASGAPKTKARQHDPRVTPVGRFLRRTSLDELPQLFNVLKGEMSLVGPRPVPVYEVAHYKLEHRERLASVPGMTGLWQIKGRGFVTFEQQILMDIEYIQKQSLWYDLRILFLTIPVVLIGRGAK